MKKLSHIVCAILAWVPLTVEVRATPSSEDGRQSAANADREAANADRAAGRAAPSRNAGTQPGRTGGRDSTQAGARAGGASKGREAAAADSSSRGSVTPQRGVGQSARGNSNADRLRSLLNAQANGHLARRQPGRAARSTRAAPIAASGSASRAATGAAPGGATRAATGAAASAATGTASGGATRAATGAATRGLGAPVPQGITPAGQPNPAASRGAASPVPRPTALPSGPAIGGPRAQGSGRVGGPAIGRTTRNATIDGSRPPHKF
jgi:hypothetical protein